MNKLSLLLSFLFTYVAGYTQSTRFCIAISEQVNEHAEKIGAYIEIMINNSMQKANQDGNIYYIPETANSYITVKMPDEKQYFIMGPSHVPLPKDPSEKINILIRKATQKEQAVLTLNKQINQLNIRIDQLDSVKKYDQLLYQQQLTSLDSLYKLATQKYQISASDLRTATEKLQGRDKYFEAISTSLESYLNEAKDIRDIFKHMLAFSLENPKSFRLFDSTINNYNAAYNQLNTNNAVYEKAVSDYWGSKELSLGFHNVFDFAINDIHRASILPLNTLLNSKVREYIHEKDKKTRQNLKEQITTELNSITLILDNSLTILESKIRYYTGQLDSNKNVYSN
jgi:hypothetical protein